MYQKVIQELAFKKKRDTQLVTPCCNKPNKDGKFVNYVGHNNIYGYCHSCGSNSKPPTLYTDEKGNFYHWNVVTQKYEPVLQSSFTYVTQSKKTCNTSIYNSHKCLNKPKKYIDFKAVTKTLDFNQENALLKYIRSRYSNKAVDLVKQKYHIGTSKNGGTVFWYINRDGKAQKAKVSYYTTLGKRTNRFEVPYKNENGYLGCLYGEHLLANNTKPVILVESEKTAIIASIELPKYTWLAYSGINGLTDAKLQVLQNVKIIIIPDMSTNAVNIMNKKAQKFQNLNIDATVYDMTFGKSDTELKSCDWYNCDVEDVLRTHNNLTN